MKKKGSAFALISLICLALFLPSFGKPRQVAVTSLIDQVLNAHNAHSADSLSAFTFEGVKFNFPKGSSNNDSMKPYIRFIRVAVKDSAFKYHRVNPYGRTEVFKLSDGQFIYRAEIGPGRPIGEVRQLSPLNSPATRLNVTTVGLLPILKQLLNPVGIVYLGQDSGMDKLKGVTASASWILYLDENHLIRKVEIGNRVIEYSDYRFTDSRVRLPFTQVTKINGELHSKLVLNDIQLDQVFPEGYFSREALAREIAR